MKFRYCNLYIYLAQISLALQFDYGYLSEMGTRLSILIEEQFQPFLQDVYAEFEQANVDYYLIGFRWGQLWKLIFDVKLS